MSFDNVGYDIIFAGGGTVACVTASRLAKADPSLRVLILEAGPHIQEEEKDDRIEPDLFPAATFSKHISRSSKALGDRAVFVPVGRCVGGSSSVNFAVYSRAAASDYDDWETKYGNPGWGSNKIIPLLKKAETFQAPSDPKIHGTAGPIKVSYAPDPPNVVAEFLTTAKEYDKDRPQTSDTNDFHNCNAYGRWPLYMDSSTGQLSDVPRNYIYNETFNNLKIQPSRRVLRVIFKNRRAIGVEYMDDIEGRAKGNPKVQISYASRLVVVSAGAFGSPAILERSGIGATSVLEKHEIFQLVDLPGVGENYMDHNAMFLTYIAREDADRMLDSAFRGKQDGRELTTSRLSRTGNDLTEGAMHVGTKMRPTLDDLKTMPEFEQRWKAHFMPSPDKPVLATGAFSGYLGEDPDAIAGTRKYFSMVYYTACPVSVGSVHTQSGTDAYEPLEFHPGYLDREEDLAVLRWGYKHTRELARRMESYRGEFEHPKFPKDSEAVTSESAQPVAVSVPNINYTPDDDKMIDNFHRLKLGSGAHSCGTCAMKPREKCGVVDSRLNVYGVQGLKVADMSITPSNVCANTYNTALAIGEKAAVIIAADLGIEGVTEE